MAEQRTLNPQVQGSNPWGRTNAEQDVRFGTPERHRLSHRLPSPDRHSIDWQSMPSAEERFRAKVVRRRGHEVWTGSVDHRGVGMVRIDGKLRTVQRAAWEFAYGPLPEGARVNTCAGERACVRIEHLSLTPSAAASRTPTSGARRAKGSGSIRQLRVGVWEVAVADGKKIDG